jgi:hypothetical protein
MQEDIVCYALRQRSFGMTDEVWDSVTLGRSWGPMTKAPDLLGWVTEAFSGAQWEITAIFNCVGGWNRKSKKWRIGDDQSVSGESLIVIWA